MLKSMFSQEHCLNTYLDVIHTTAVVDNASLETVVYEQLNTFVLVFGAMDHPLEHTHCLTVRHSVSPTWCL